MRFRAFEKGELILASNSPRRRGILKNLGIPFRVVDPLVTEVNPDPYHVENHQEIARHKVESAFARLPKTRCKTVPTLMGFDTLVVIDQRPLGKPGTRAEAIEMVARLEGRSHTVLTAVAIFQAGEWTGGVEATRVFFKKLTPGQIAHYVDAETPFDMAGGYGIQGRAALFISRIEGCYYNVMGLPIALLETLFNRQGRTLQC